ncbi:MAG TPA: hypothetical protein VEI26_07260 [Terriglobales bacterium]|nr:hypothetical protein [Terriglobales bacterium]
MNTHKAELVSWKIFHRLFPQRCSTWNISDDEERMFHVEHFNDPSGARQYEAR